MTRFDHTRIHPHAPTGSTEVNRMLMPEDMARIRQHDLLIEARRDRLARQATAGRWWRRLARYAHQRADHAEGAITRP
ncbi:hypothetical protein GCM10027271_19680 [Saccharopolyspora gloriosae]|uniref:Uncharacterized protein n=1 Tax=Saccharopolyspora gloriosae TaxID=455344 RepID=A0A840NBK2_9PSEU|nr:hypothetical protein [Saccharopolyspora gloriosae]MBB5067515.1 hypothetical protein [Saccharopolyspora gloriosae]